MKTITNKLLTLTSVAMLSVGLAAQVDPAVVPAESQWLVFADLDAMRQTDLGAEMLGRVQEEYAGHAEELDEPIVGELRVDALMSQIMETIGSVTAYGTNLSGDPDKMDGMALIEGTDKLRTIAEGLIAHMMLSEPDRIDELGDMPFEAYRIEGEVVVGFPEDPVILVSRSKQNMVAGLEVYRGGGASLANHDGMLRSMLPADDSYYLLATSAMPDADLPDENTPHARILKMTEAASMVLVDAGDDVLARATLVAESGATAERLHKIVDGMTALLSLAQDSDEDLRNFIESVKVERSDRRVEVEMRYPTAKLIDLADANMNRREHEQERRERQMEAAFSMPGDVVSTWHADQDLGSPEPDANTFTEHTTEPVALNPGDRVVIGGMKRGNDWARLDYVELVPAGESAGVRHEVEFMRLSNYRIQRHENASAGEFASVRGGRGIGRAQMIFNGAPGDYVMKVGYVDENDGKAQFKISVVRPDLAE